MVNNFISDDSATLSANDPFTRVLGAVFALTFISCVYSVTTIAAVHAITINQGNRQVELTPQGGVAVSDNGGNATTSDHSIAVAHGNGSQSDATGHSVAVSTANGNGLSFSKATGNSVANSNAKDTGPRQAYHQITV